MRLDRCAVTTIVVARIEQSEIRDSLSIERLIPDFAALNPGYERVQRDGPALSSRLWK
jgi:hypothetical protein